ncbi:hypothetical protein JGUZn3_08350 [Entomobacter blattae]|uniref:Uncharacterized protein n=2 Tax=Entomobacter blattae TaxID=2762277 RepID=A0A7H1NQK7_9PROT|nr:hypothetical protein JGUZn3_08350 [Entomobacter blattae]
MDLRGGTGDLKSIPLDYLHNLKLSKSSHKPFAHKPMKHPVIIVLDNDDGLEPVAKAAKEVHSKLTRNNEGSPPVTSPAKETSNLLIEIPSTADFYHVTENLYIVKAPEKKMPTPKTLKKELYTCIEDLFPEKWRNHEINGKKLSLTNGKEFDSSKHYSKMIFAKSVLKANADKIDFSGFDPLLERIQKAILHHAAKQ